MSDWYDNPTAKMVIDYQQDDGEMPIIRKVNMDDNVDPCCGIDLICFDKSDIEWLMQGKPLYAECNGGEYAHLFLLKLKGGNIINAKI